MVSSDGSNEVTVLLNNGAGMFPTQQRYLAFGGADALTAADLDGDGDADIAVANDNHVQLAPSHPSHLGTVSLLRANRIATYPTVNISEVIPDPRLQAVSDIQIAFSTPVVNFELQDLLLTRDGSGNLLPGEATLTTQDGMVWTLNGLDRLTSPPGVYRLQLIANGSGIKDLRGNPLAGDALDTWSNTRLLGDTDLSGHVDFADFVTLANNFGGLNAKWQDGDFDGDGKVGFNDFVLLANNFGSSSG